MDPFFLLKKKPTKKKILTETSINNGNQNEENLKELIDSHKAIKKEVKVKKLRSSIQGIKDNSDLNRSKTNPIQNVSIDKKKNNKKDKKLNQKNYITKSKSIDTRILKNKIFDTNYFIPKINEKKKRSLPNKKKIIDDYKNKI